MGIEVISANDTVTLNGHVFADLAFGDVSRVVFPNDLVNTKTGKNGNTAFAQNATGYNANLELRVMRGSPDDQYLSGLLPQPGADFSQTVLLNGTFVKSLGDGSGNITHYTYTLQGGVVSKIPEGKENVEGDTEQAVVAYMVKFAQGQRVIS